LGRQEGETISGVGWVLEIAQNLKVHNWLFLKKIQNGSSRHNLCSYICSKNNNIKNAHGKDQG
jgi:hypothetical protein